MDAFNTKVTALCARHSLFHRMATGNQDVCISSRTLERDYDFLITSLVEAQKALKIYSEIDESWWSLVKVVVFKMRIGNWARQTLENIQTRAMKHV